MASKVNTKFIVILSLAIVALVAGAGGLFVYSQLKSAERNVQRAEDLTAQADEALAAGDEELAYELYQDAMTQRGIAVNKQRTNLEYIEAWAEAALRTRPDNPDVYRDNFNSYQSALSTIAQLQPSNPEPQIDFLLTRLDFIRRAESAAAYESYANEVGDRLNQLTALSDEEQALIRGLRAWATVEQMFRTSVSPERRTEAREALEAARRAAAELDEDRIPQLPELRELFADARLRWAAAEVRSLISDARPRLASQTYEEQRPAVESIADEWADRSLPVLLSRITFELANPDERALTDAERQARAETIETLRNEALDRMLALEPGEEPVFTLQRYFQTGVPRDRTDDVRRLARTAHETFPGKPSAMVIAARILERLGDVEAAMRMHQRIVDMPTPPLSLEGFELETRRVESLLAQADLAIRRYRRTSDPAERERALADAKDYLQRARDRAGVRFDNAILLVGADIKLIEGDYAGARADFSRFRQEAGATPRVLAGLARAAAALNNLDAAADLYEQLLREQPIGSGGGIDSLQYTAELSDIYARQGNTRRALQLITSVSDVISSDLLTRRAAALRAVLAEEIRDDIVDAEQRLDTLTQGTDAYDNTRARLRDLRSNLDEITREGDLPEDIQLLAEVERIAQREGPDAAIERLREGLERMPDNPRIHEALIRGLFGTGAADAADAAIARAQQRFPDNEAFDRWRERFDTRDVDPYTRRVTSIENNPELSELERQIELARAAIVFERVEDARDATRRALEIDQNNPDAIELAFAIAIGSDEPDLARAAQLRDRAASINADNLEGLTFDARLAAAEGDLNRAIELYREATRLIPTEPRLWRFLANALVEADRPIDAIEAYERALEGRSDDIRTAQAYAATLQAVGRTREALDAIGPDSPVFEQTRRIPDLRHLWLELEAAVGDRERALEQRRQLFERAPDNGRNTLAYFELLTNTSDFQRAREVLDTVRNNPDARRAFGRAAGAHPDLAVARSEAVLRGASGEREEAVQSFRQQLDTLAATTQDASPFVSFASFALLMADESPEFEEDAFQALEQGRQYQDASALEADNAIANIAQTRAAQLNQRAGQLATRGRSDRAAELGQRAQRLYQRAATANQRIIDAGTASEQLVARANERLARVATQLGEFDRARAAIERTLDEQPEDLDALLLKARIERQSGDEEAARQTLDAAVAAHPDEHRPFLARAILNSDVPELYPDVMADLETVHRLRPAETTAWALRFDLMLKRAEGQRAFAQLNDAIEQNPSAAPALRRLLIDFYRRTGQNARATEVAVTVADDNPDDFQSQALAAQLAAEAERFRDAARLYRRIRDSEQIREGSRREAVAAAGLLDAILRTQANPVPGEVIRLLDDVERIAEGDVGLTMLRARARQVLGEPDRSLSLVREALDTAGDDAAALRVWRETLPLVIGEDPAQQFVSRLIRSGDAPAYLRLADLRRRAAGFNADQVAAAADQARAIRQLALDNDDRALAVEASRFLIQMLYASGEHEEAVAVGEAAVDLAPRDPQLNNDTAYIIATELGDYDRALPYAETAYAVAQDDAAILDTVAVVYLGLGQHERAVQILRQARSRTQREDILVPVNVHLAEGLLELDRIADAGDALREATRAARAVPESLRNRYQPQIDELQQRLNN